MKRLIALVLLFSFLTVNFSKLIILVHYQLNKAEITEKYCINKDKPEMHCCGKCLLKKKLAQQEEQQKYPTFPDIKTDMQLYCNSESIVINHNEGREVNINSIDKAIYSLINADTIFHPPCA